MQAWKGESYDLLSFMYHVCGNKIIVIVIIVVKNKSSWHLHVGRAWSDSWISP